MKMKLSTVALSTAVILGAIVTGGSWYTGKQLEQYYPQYIQEANQKLIALAHSYSGEVEIQNVKLERHLFSSDISYDLSSSLDKNTDAISFKAKGKIYHGPLPLNRLLKGNIIPAMVSSETTIIAPEEIAKFFESPEFISATLNVSYGENFSGKIASKAFKAEDFPFEASAISGNFELAKSGKGSVNLQVPSYTFYNLQMNQKFKLDNAVYHSEWEKESPYPLLSIGNVDMKASAYSISEINPTESGKTILFKDVLVKGNNKLQNEIYGGAMSFSSEVDVASNKIKQSLGKLKMDMSAEVDANALNAVLSQPEKIAESGKALFAHPFKYHLKNFSLENEKGKNEISLIVNSDAFNTNITDIKQFLSVFKQSKFETTLNIGALEQLFQQSYSLFPPKFNPNIDAGERAKKSVNELVAQAQKSGLAVLDNDNLRLKLEIDEGNVKLNGEEVPEKQVRNVTMMAMFALGGIMPRH